MNFEEYVLPPEKQIHEDSILSFLPTKTLHPPLRLYTGDIAKRDIDGFYYITGRMKRFVKVYGNRVNLDTVEQLIKPLVLSCACIGVDDKITVFLTENTDERQ